jgi:imidazolonepropionase-like amidohydrolase
MADEIAALVGIGIPPSDVLIAATRSGAELCGLGDRLGTVEPGKLADLIVVDGDPLEDLSALRRIKMVMQNGQIVS